MPNLCGVNQKQLSEALFEIKRGTHSSTSSTSTPPSIGSLSISGSPVDKTNQNGSANGVSNKLKKFLRNSHASVEQQEE